MCLRVRGPISPPLGSAAIGSCMSFTPGRAVPEYPVVKTTFQPGYRCLPQYSDVRIVCDDNDLTPLSLLIPHLRHPEGLRGRFVGLERRTPPLCPGNPKVRRDPPTSIHRRFQRPIGRQTPFSGGLSSSGRCVGVFLRPLAGRTKVVAANQVFQSFRGSPS
jgi:hypothetical protein